MVWYNKSSFKTKLLYYVSNSSLIEKEIHLCNENLVSQLMITPKLQFKMRSIVQKNYQEKIEFVNADTYL